MKIKFEEFLNEANQERDDYFVFCEVGNQPNCDILIDVTLDEAETTSWAMAQELYQSYEGLHGMRSYSEIEEEMREEDEDVSEDDITMTYNEEIESWASYYAEKFDPNSEKQLDYLKQEGLRNIPVKYKYLFEK